MKQSDAFFDKFQKIMVSKVVPVANKISNQRHLAALRDGLTNLVPFTVIGGLSLMIANPPVNEQLVHPTNWFYDFLLLWLHWANQNSNLLTIPFNLSIGIISIYVVLGVSYRLADYYKMAALPNSLVALMTFMAVATPPKTIKSIIYLRLDGFGANTMFCAIIIALLVIEINRFMENHNMTIKMPSSVPPAVAAPFQVLLPLVINLVLFLGVNQILKVILHASLANLIFVVFQPMMNAGSSLLSMTILVEVALIFWFFGIHGDNMISAVTTPIWTANLVQNLQEYASHKTLTNIYSGNFAFIFGEAIVYFAIMASMLSFAKSPQLKSLSHLSWPATLFNINEPQVFGIPTVMNLFTFIPSFICILINMPIAYYATTLGLMSKTAISVPWTLPAPLYAIISTLDWRAGVVWLLEFLIDFVIIAPFVIAYDKQLIKKNEITEEKKEI